MKASKLIKHLEDLISEYGDLDLVGIGTDSDYGTYSIDEFYFEKSNDIVKDNEGYRYEKSFKKEETIEVFLINI